MGTLQVNQDPIEIDSNDWDEFFSNKEPAVISEENKEAQEIAERWFETKCN